MKSLVLLGGGVDGTVCLADTIKKHGVENVATFTVDYGQKNEKMLIAAAEISNYYKVKNIRVDLTSIYKDCNCPTLRFSKEKMEHGSMEELEKEYRNAPVKTAVPYLLGNIISAAAAVAWENDYECIMWSVCCNHTTRNAYPDGTSIFVHTAQTQVSTGSGNKVKLVTPFIDLTTADLVRMGKKYNVPFEKTVSCFDNHEKACGLCPSCRARIDAFKEAGVKDPIPYEVN